MVASGDDVTAYDVNLALQHNAGPSTLGVTDFTATSGTTEKLLDTWTGTVTAGHKYKIKYVWAYQATVLNDRFFIRIREGLTTAGTQIAVVNKVHLEPINTLVPGIPTEAEWTASVTTAAQSFCATIERNTGTGTATVRGFTSQQRILSVVWLGPYA